MALGVDYICGIFSSEEKANKFIDKHFSDNAEYYIDESELDVSFCI